MSVAYPNFPILQDGSKDDFVGGPELTRMSNGGLKGRSFMDVKHECVLAHLLDESQWDALIAVYNTSVTAPDTVGFTWPTEVAREYKFASYPDRKPADGGDWRVTVMLLEA